MAAKGIHLFPSDPQAGLDRMKQAQALCPENYSLAFNMGQALYRMHRHKEAYQVWKKLAEKEPRAQLLVNLGWLALELGLPDEAMDWVSKDPWTASADPGALAVAMEVYFLRGDYQGALDLYKHCGADMAKPYRILAVDYFVETLWRQFRQGKGEEATQAMSDLADDLPETGSILEARDRMVAALMDSSVAVPEPFPLPHELSQGRFTGAVRLTGAELDVANLPVTLNPRNDAYALIVGIDQYRYFEGPEFASRDARQVQRLLSRFGGFSGGLRNVRLRTNREATRAALTADIQWLEQIARKNSKARVVFYYAGACNIMEGVGAEDEGDVLLYYYDARPGATGSRAGISLRDTVESFADLKNFSTAVIMDVCLPGDNHRDRLLSFKNWVDRVEVGEDVSWFGAFSADSVSRAYIPGRQGAFTYFLLQGLMGRGDLDHDGWVTSREASGFAAYKIKTLGVASLPICFGGRSFGISKVRLNGR